MSLNASDADYLQAYLGIAEKYLSESIDLDEAQVQLEDLNEKYADSLSDGIMRTRMVGIDIVNKAAERDGWYDSSCW